MNAGIGIFYIPKSSAYPKSSGDKKTLKDLVWKASEGIDGEQVHEEKGRRHMGVYSSKWKRTSCCLGNDKTV